MKIAFVSQPFEDITPFFQETSISLCTYQLSRCLRARSHHITIYARKGRSQPKELWHQNIHYHYIQGTDLEAWILRFLKLFERLARYPSSKRPIYSLPVYYWGYIKQIANKVRAEQFDIVHIHNFSQFVPIIRAAINTPNN